MTRLKFDLGRKNVLPPFVGLQEQTPRPSRSARSRSAIDAGQLVGDVPPMPAASSLFWTIRSRTGQLSKSPNPLA